MITKLDWKIFCRYVGAMTIRMIDCKWKLHNKEIVSVDCYKNEIRTFSSGRFGRKVTIYRHPDSLNDLTKLADLYSAVSISMTLSEVKRYYKLK
jgi:hypothetical protein